MLLTLCTLTLATSLLCGAEPTVQASKGPPRVSGDSHLVADYGPDNLSGSFLFQQSCSGVYASAAIRYDPQPGDLVLFDDLSPTWRVLFHLAGSAMPDHSGIVVALPDGRIGILESGPDDGHLMGPYIGIPEAMPRLHQFQGTLYIRRLVTPLTADQSCRLTAFAMSKAGKHYAVWRLLLQGTPIRPRGPLREQLFGRTDLNRSRYLCAELAVAAGTAAGLFDPSIHKANTMYPKELFDDQKFDLSATWHPSAIWGPSPILPIPCRANGKTSG